ncbi:MAG: PCMD domain-containing protein, partial [Bacteroidales bacterium]|nr:PCMD domain-containing protein [Bacteroidales bacterium]
NGTTPEYKHVAVAGEGKAAAKIESKKVLWVFVAGNLYTGNFVRIVNFAGAELNFGIPFNARPKSLSGYVHYIPKPINYAKAPYLEKKGQLDSGKIEVVLTDWDKPYNIVTNDEEFIDGAKDPHVIGRGYLLLDKDTGGYIHFDIPINYRNDKTPKYVVIIVAASNLGDYFTGGSGSTAYVDEFQFNY